jgi:16S rRNA (uracil1498-N3)-methyltransferase
LNKWRQAAIEAAKQSAQAWVPTLHPPKPLSDVLRGLTGFDLVLVAATCEAPKALSLDALRTPKAERIMSFIGPEGGWAAEEFEAIVHAGAEPVTLGPNILRIETAAIALCAGVHALMRPE